METLQSLFWIVGIMVGILTIVEMFSANKKK